MVTLHCRHCGKEYTTSHAGKLYCSTYCRRKYQDERRKDERAEAREQRQLDVLVSLWRMEYGVEEFRDQCTGCRFAKMKAREVGKGWADALVCDLCRMG